VEAALYSIPTITRDVVPSGLLLLPLVYRLQESGLVHEPFDKLSSAEVFTIDPEVGVIQPKKKTADQIREPLGPFVRSRIVHHLLDRLVNPV
jgi:hypothetical protein